MMAVVMMMNDGESQWTNARKSSGDDGHDDGSDHAHCGEIPARRKRHEVRARLHLQRHPAVVPALGCLREHRWETFASRRVAPRSGITSQEHEELTSCLQQQQESHIPGLLCSELHGSDFRLHRQFRSRCESGCRNTFCQANREIWNLLPTPRAGALFC